MKIEKYYPYAFTLIELLIVVTIIAIIGISSISWFSRMTELQDAETTIKIIADTVNSYDQAIAKHEMISYETTFESGSVGFVTNVDAYKKTTPVSCLFDFTNGTGIITSSDTSTGVWELNFSSPDIPDRTFVLSASGGTQIFSFPSHVQKKWQKISSKIGDRGLNSFALQYYNLTSVENTPEREVHLMSIKGGNGIVYSSLIVRNILGMKVLQGSGTSLDNLEKATLLFEKNGKEAELVISL